MALMEDGSSGVVVLDGCHGKLARVFLSVAEQLYKLAVVPGLMKSISSMRLPSMTLPAEEVFFEFLLATGDPR